MIAGSCGVRSRLTKPSKAVCAESSAVGSAAHSTPMAESTGSAMVCEQLPMQEKS